MLKNGYLKESDIRGTVYYSIANGEIAEGTKINMQKIEVGKQILYNVEASIVHSTEAPLLFGQSAMERFGKFTMDYSNSNLIINGTSNSVSNSTNLSSIKSVKIGNQTWMTENLNVDRFRNGDLIPEAKTDEEWKNAGENKQPAWCYYENDPKNGKKYGRLYNWYAVSDPRGLAPYGWHVPSNLEWANLIDYLGGDLIAGGKIKSKVVGDYWGANKTINSEFTATPGGFRPWYGTFQFIQETAEWWTSTMNNEGKIWTRYITYMNEKVQIPSRHPWWGAYLRCIKD
jgi:uncharacterized protein (TIGR02145 family)